VLPLILSSSLYAWESCSSVPVHRSLSRSIRTSRLAHNTTRDAKIFYLIKTLAFNGCREWCAGSSKSEGGFEDGRYAAGSLLDFNESKDTKGKKYYKYRLLVRSADGNEGGRHYLVSSTVGSDGQLYICKVGYTHVEVEATTSCRRLNSFLLRVCTACMHACIWH
jgi:hypothetical protein